MVGPAVADLAWAARRAELASSPRARDAGDRALRELLALQCSDWAFLAGRATAGEYPRERFAGHLAGLRAALAGDDDAVGPAVRNLAAHLDRAALLEP